MKSSKTESAKYIQKNGAIPLGETGPLFPRLHVSETEKAGPRAPPRNKMALFEQFTVPSHRFVQPSRTSTATSNQQQQFVPNDCRHPDRSCYMPSLTPHSIVNPGAPSHSQPSHDISSCLTSSGSTSIADEESQRASRSLTVETSVGVSRLTAKEDGRGLMKQKEKVASNDIIPGEDLQRAEAKDAQEVPNTTSVESVERPVTTNFMNNLQEALSIVEKLSRCPVVESRNDCDQEMAELTGSTEVIDNVQLKRVALKSRAEGLDEHNQGHVTSCEQPVYIAASTRPGKALSEDELLHMDDLAESGKNNDLWASRDGSMAAEEQIPSSSGSSLIDNAQTTSTSQESSGPPHISKDTQDICPSDGEKGDAAANRLSADDLLKDRGESTWESQNNQICSNEGSELSQHGTGLQGSSSGSSSSGLQGSSSGSSSSGLAAQAIRPNDVIRAVGQQQFWKARKALLRQQRVFSDQVFQLHKLIKVQQLMAQMPGTLIDEEEMSFGAMDECAASPSHRNITKREHGCGEKAHNKGSGFEERNEGQARERGTQLEVMQKPEWFAAVGNDGRGPQPYLPAFSPGGISAWGYPSLGMGQWMGPIAAQGRPSAYQPFAGTFAPGAPYGGPYGSAVLGPVSPMVPLGIPYGGPRNEPWEETRSNHGPTAGLNHQAAPAMLHTPSHMANDFSGAWHFMHFNNPYYNQRPYSSTSEKDVPTGSGASINNRRPAKTVRSSEMQHQWGEASHTRRLNTNGLENCVHQRENLFPCAVTGSKFKASTSMPSIPVSRKTDSQQQEGKHPAQNLNRKGVFQTPSFERYEANKSGGKEEAKTTAMRRLKPGQSNQVPLKNGHSEETFVDCSSDDALDLFPLVPSLSPDEQSGSKQGREHWQGRVIKAVPHPAVAASQSAAGILLSLQRERKH